MKRKLSNNQVKEMSGNPLEKDRTENQTESVEDGGGGSGSGGGDGGGGGSGGGGGGGATDRSTSGHSGGSSGGGGGSSSVAEEASTKVARVNAASTVSRSTIVQDGSMAETTTTSRFSTATTKVKTIKIVKKTSPLIASAISDLNSRAEASHGGASPRRPLASGSKKVVRPIKIQQETPTTTKMNNKDVSKATDGKVSDVKVKETKVEVVKVCDSNSKETSVAGASTSSTVNSENTKEVPSKAVTVSNAQLSENEASYSTGKVIPIIRKGSPGPKQPSKAVTTSGKASKSLNNAKEAVRPKRQSSPLSKTEESAQTSQNAPQTEQTRLSNESEKAAVEPSLNSTETENPENSKIATVSSSASVSSSSSISSSASTASVSSSKTVKAVKIKKPAKTKKQESTEVAPDDTTKSEAAASERIDQKKEKVANDLEGKAYEGKDDSTKDKVENYEKITSMENGLEAKDGEPGNESCVAEAKDDKTKNESKETKKDVKSEKKESKASCDNVNEKAENMENNTSTSKINNDETERETSEKIESKIKTDDVTTLARKEEGNEGESKAEDIRLTNGETGEHEKQEQEQQQQDVTSLVPKVPAIPPPPPPPPPQSPKKSKPIGKVKARKATTVQDTTEDGQTSPQEATGVPEISVSGAAALSNDVPKIDINGESDGKEDTHVTNRESGAIAKWDPQAERDTEEPELDSVFVVVRDMSGFNASVNQVTLTMSTQATCGQLMAEVGRKFKYDPDSFSLVLQCSNGDQVEVEKMEAERALAHAKFRIEGTARNNLILCDLGGRPPRRTDDDDLTLGASASPTTTIAIPATTTTTTEKTALERSFIAYDTSATTSDYSSYSSQLINHNCGNFVGLVNQAMTCYLNSLLQTLFMTPEFRNALYQWEFKGNEEEASKNIPCQLQRLFLQLQTTNKNAVETTKLTRSFGWDSSEAWQQHDIQELCRVMFDALEQCFKNTHQSDLINTLYEGKMKDYVKCLRCGNERAREDTYLDIPLPIKHFGSPAAYKSVEDALQAFVSPELLSDNNQYKCSQCDALCDAHKGLKFTRFPYLLTIHLMRFDFDYQTLHRIKLNDKVTFPDILDLNHLIDDGTGTKGEDGEDKPASDVDNNSTSDSGSSLDGEDASYENTSGSLPESDYQEEDEGIDVSSSSAYNNERNRALAAASGGGPYVYQLFSIMVHSGSASGGHYYAYIKDFTSGEWYCFNDQSVTKITYEDIRKTYGGSSSTRGGSYYSSWSYSANAYMLMYRRVDRERNVNSLTAEEFPQHIKDLIKRMSEEEAAERERRELERSTCHIKLFCRIPGQSQTVERKFRVHRYSTLTEATQQAYKELGLENIVPLERCRLVKYEEFHESLESSFEGMEKEPMYEVLGGVRTSYKFDLLMEIRDEDKQFEVYKPGGTTIKAHVVNLSTEEVEGPFTLRGSLSMTVQDLKELLGRSLDLNHETMRVVLERYYNDLRPLTSDTKTLKMEGFYRSNKVYVEASGEEAVDFFSGSQMYSILDRYENTITLYCPLPDTSPEALEELQIPPYKEEVLVEATAETDGPCSTVATDEPTTPSTTTTTTTTAVVTETTDITASSAPPPASSPAESAASPASCSSKDSGISSKGGITDTGSSSDGSGTISRGSSLVSPTSSSSSSSPTTSTSSPSSSSSSSSPSSVTQQTSPQQQHLPSPSPLAVTTITTITCATPSSTPTASPTAASTMLVLGNCSDGEDEGIADADSGTGSSHVNSDQSASEDSSLTSDSDRTLVGEPPEDRLSDTSNSPDYHNVSPPTDPVGAASAATSATTAEAKAGDETGGGWGLPIFQDTDAAWGEDEKTTPQLKRYFRAEYFTEEDTGARMLRVWVDKRITIGQLKQEMQRWVGVSQDHFKLFKIYSNSQEFECTRMTESLTSYGDNTRLSVRLGRALLPGEHRGKVYLLEPHNFEDPSKFLIDWVVRKGDTIANAKRAIVREVNARCPGMNLVPERVRLRKKSWKTPQAIYLDQHKFDDDITLFSNWELFLQVLDGPEQKTANVDELAIFIKRWRPSSHTTDPLTEIIIPEPTTSALRAKLSEVSEISAENIEFAKGKGTFPCDMSVLDIASELDWSPRTGQLDQRPLYIMDDGAMIYYRDKTELVKELTEEQRRDLAVSENQRLNRESQYCPSSSFTPSTSSYSTLRSREKGLKIYLNHDD